ncbi:selenide, water dikinase SelD [Yoonia sp. 208BN28-4]|uniref:selenide, water dikinase SelD n=1 Tax=Yoonia sp. 208BN28-4 TaxID=3126505 RepID=UPI0030A70116
MNTSLPLTRDLVLIGGGHTHALVLRQWAMKPLAGVRLTLINPGPTAPYSGMLPGFVAGHYTRDELDIDLVQLARFAGARLVLGAVTAIDPVRKLISVPGRPDLAYDVTAIDVGITSAMPALRGFADHGIPAKPLGPFASRWNTFRAQADQPRVAIIGGGVAGAELAMAMAYALREKGVANALVQLVDRGTILKDLGPQAQAKMRSALDQQGVTLIENADVVEVTATSVRLADGTEIASDFTTGAAGAKPHDWLATIGVETHDGFVAVNKALQSSDPSIFAVGDCAHLTYNPRPKAGVYAVREAPVLFDNLRAVLSGGALRDYVPQRDYLKLVSQGGQVALAEKFGRAWQGRMLWRLKNHIDRKFMNQFTAYPQMPMPDLPLTIADGVTEALGDKPMCGGCGAKVGRGALSTVLSRMPKSTRADIQSVPGDDAAILKTGGAVQVMTTDHLRKLTDDPVLMTRIAAVHALGDIWAMGAAPQAATINIILPRLSAQLQERTLTEIMAAASDVMTEAGAAIVGGHTSVGDELTLGFTVTGLAERAPITLSGAQAGDTIILTKPLGSGVIMAAEMQTKAKGADVAACLDLMVLGQAAASRCLAGAHAMTDVTGFGLAGHLNGICEASGVGADINLNDIPMMQGAVDLAQAGVRSSLYPDNRAGAGPVHGAAGAVAELLFDPQTAGGLLAAVPAAKADAVLADLRQAGYPAAMIGSFKDGPAQVTVHS